MREASLRRVFAASLAGAALLAGSLLVRGPADGDAEARKRRRPSPLRVAKMWPRHGKTFVDLGAIATVRFNDPILLSSVTPTTVSFRPLLGEDVEYRASLEAGGRRLVLAPDVPLEPGTDYEVVVRPGLATEDGRTLRKERRAIFYTDPRFSPYPLIRPDQFHDLDDPMVEGRALHTASLLADGRVLFGGGMVDGVNFAITGELFDPLTEAFHAARTPHRNPRAGHAAVDVWSSVLLVGGYFSTPTGIQGVQPCDFFDRATQGWVTGPTLVEQRDFTAACVLADGRVLVTGGLAWDANGLARYSTTAEIIDFNGVSRLTTGKPLLRRAGHTATRLPDGTVLIVGGIASSANFSPAAEVFDPVTETFRNASGAPSEHRQLHTATWLPDTKEIVFADGGDPIVEVYDTTAGRFFNGGGSSFFNRTLAAASRFGNDRILFSGGLEQRGDSTIILSSMDLFLRSSGDRGRMFRVGTLFSEPRAGHTSTTLLDGRILIAGGLPADAAFVNLESATLFTPDEQE